MENGFLSISEMASLARVTRDTLIHYDKIGLVRPVARGENNYRYYSDEQLALVNIIHTFQSLGMSLKEINEIAQNRTPESIVMALSEQTQHIDNNIEDLIKARKLLMTLKTTIEDAAGIDERAIGVCMQGAESIFLGPQNDYSNGRTVQDNLINFYRYCQKSENDIDLNYSAWGIFSAQRIRQGDWNGPDYFYFNNPYASDTKPGGLYVTGYIRSGYGKNDKLYRRLIAYINEHDLEICGPAYESYILNEISIRDPNNYLMRISIRIKQK
ncbi:MAG: MerR family transcriptional regulator [Clostridiales Family XIII bacterium]|jgi:DNA-binding transcriptional MerR regulator|nr:MerR family transcriptional regulator [Clostridiales Family XIII bacterium]